MSHTYNNETVSATVDLHHMLVWYLYRLQTTCAEYWAYWVFYNAKNNQTLWKFHEVLV